jgi:hypothetical protein
VFFIVTVVAKIVKLYSESFKKEIVDFMVLPRLAGFKNKKTRLCRIKRKLKSWDLVRVCHKDVDFK